MLDHSKQTYGPLSSELRPHRVRSRTSSRASPYPLRSPRSVISPDRSKSHISSGRPFASPQEHSSSVLREISIDPNISACSAAPAIEVKPFSPFSVELDRSKVKAPVLGHTRQRVTSSARRNALGWKKRAGKNAAADKENIRQDITIT